MTDSPPERPRRRAGKPESGILRCLARNAAVGAAVFLAAAWPAARSAAASPGADLPPLHVAGTKLLDDRSAVVRLHGVNVPSLEWADTGDHIPQSLLAATGEWHANIIRLPLSQDRWFGRAPGQTDGGKGYRAIVGQAVSAAAKNCAYVILDLHWSDGGRWGEDIGQHRMPDRNSVAFWRSLAAAYANRPNVLFDLYNEPHDIPWSVWKNGGTVTDHATKDAPDRTYAAPGMQELLDTVRAAGAKNVVLAGGPGWASDFSGLFQGYTLSDPRGHGVIYSNHVYPFGGEDVPAWTRRMEKASRSFPIFIGEFGSDPPGGHGEDGAHWVRHMLSVLQAHGWNWTAWCFHPAATPCLIADFRYTPTPHFGVFVKEALAGRKIAYTPAPPPTGSETVYDDALRNFWQSYGWATLDYDSKSPVHSGTAAIAVNADAYQALSLHHDPFNASRFRAISFWIDGGPAGGQTLKVQATLGGKPQKEFMLPPLEKETWRHVVVPLADLGAAGKPNMDGFWIQSLSNARIPPFFVDDIELIGAEK